MNPAAILALMGDLYQQVAALTEENKALREALESTPPHD
jgi:hypothetical protein